MESKGKFRSSIFSIFDNTLRLTWIAIVIIITNFAIIVKKINDFNLNININLLLIFFLFFFIFVVLIYYFINWNISRFEIKKKFIVIYKNIFLKDRKEILIKNIANICISKNIFERIFKLTRIRIYSDEKNKVFCDFEVILANNKFNKYINIFIKESNINDLILNNKKSLNFNFFDILKHSFFTIPMSSIIIIINFILILFNMITNGTLIKEVIYNFLGLVVTLVGIILPVIYSISKNIIKYINFKIIRYKNYIFLSYGFFTFKQYIIPVNKINGIIIDVSILSKIFGFYKANIVNSGIGDRKNKLEILFPVSRKSKCKEIIKLILPEYNIDIDRKRQPCESFVIITSKIFLIMIVLVIPTIYVNIKLALVFSLILFFSIFFIYFIKKTIISDNYICIINGIFLKRIRIIKYSKIENIVIKEGIISKKFKLCKIYINILASIKNRKISSGYIKEDELNKIINSYM